MKIFFVFCIYTFIHSRYDVIAWTAFNATHVFMPDEHSNIAPLADALLRDITVSPDYLNVVTRLIFI